MNKTPLTPAQRRFRTSVLKTFRDDGFQVQARNGEMAADIHDSLGCPFIHFDIEATVPSIPELFRRLNAPHQAPAIVVSATAETPFVAVSMPLWREMLHSIIEADKKERIERWEESRKRHEARAAELQAEMESKE
jgi:hypothetical protein